MKLNKLAGVLAVASLLSAGSAFADQIYLNSPKPNGLLDANSTTAGFAQFGLDWKAKSSYTDSDGDGVVDPGEAVVDTVVKDYTDAGVSINNYYGEMSLIPNIVDKENFGLTWGLYFDYTLNGTVLSASGSSIIASYTSGTIDIYYDDYVGQAAGDAGRDISVDDRVMRINVTGSGGDVANFLLFGEVAEVDANYFFFADGDKDFNTLVGSGMVIKARVDTNLDTNEVPSGPAGGTLTRQATLNGSGQFSVPEPGSLALLGLGLLGAGVVRRIKKAA